METERCNGSGRLGVMPDASLRSSERMWAEFREGRIYCQWCRGYVEHDGKGRVIKHAKRVHNETTPASGNAR